MSATTKIRLGAASDKTIEIKVLEPNTEAYRALASELENELAIQGVNVKVVLCFSEPTTIGVLVSIGAGVVGPIVWKVIERLLDLRAKETGKETDISVHVQITNKIYLLPKDRDKLLDEYPGE
jgi:hypothetical protein